MKRPGHAIFPAKARKLLNHSMMARLLLLALVPLLLVQAAPAAASWATQVPEPSDLALFALGLLGVIIGRHGFQRRQKGKGRK